MFVHNNCRHDARVLKEAKTLAEVGHDVRIIAVLDKDTEPYEQMNGFRIIRVALDPVNRRAIGAVMDAERYAAGSILRPILQLPAWAYHLTKRRPARSPHKIKQPSVSAPREIEEPSAAGSYEAEQPSKSVFYRVGQWILSSVWSVGWGMRGRARTRLNRILKRVNRPFDRVFFSRDYWQRSWMAIRYEPADVYHCHDLNTLPVGYKAKRRTGGKLVYDSHELFAELAYIPRLERMWWRVLERFLIHRADEVITTGIYRAEYLANKYRVVAPTVILNCPPLQPAQAPNRALHEKLGLIDESAHLILYQGGFGQGRGLDKLVLAAAYLKDYVLVLMGWGRVEAELRSLAKKEGLERRVYFTEPVAPDEVIYYCLSASVGVVIVQNTGLNNYYATPNKLYEYINAGLPVVSSDFPALREVVEEYGLGSTFDPEKPESIAGAISWVLADARRYDRMKKNALEAAKIFNWGTESAKLLDIYRGFGQPVDDRTALRPGI
jgi:glycosyltransferase involved in cell wall biosynthesis